MPHGTPADGKFVWSDDFKLGYVQMDDTHQEFVELVGALEAAGDAEFCALFHRFVEHTERHFALERQWMTRTEFPARDCHVEEHDKVLASVRQVEPLIEAGRFDIGRSLVAALHEWFPGHADYLDSALAQWLVNRSAGGVPIVLKRRSKLIGG
jgi:hemerythrin